MENQKINKFNESLLKLPIPKGTNSDFEMRLTNIWALIKYFSKISLWKIEKF